MVNWIMLIPIRRRLTRLTDDLTFWRGFGWGVIGLAIAGWYFQGFYSQLSTTGYSWMFFIYFSLSFIVFSHLLEKASIAGCRNILYSLGLIFGMMAVSDTIWIVINDHFVRNLFAKGFRLGWFVSPHMSRNLVLGLGLFVYYKLFRDKVMRVSRLLLISVGCYVLFWFFYISIGTPDWRQPATLTVINQFEALLLQQFGFRGFASLVFTSPLLNRPVLGTGKTED